MLKLSVSQYGLLPRALPCTVVRASAVNSPAPKSKPSILDSHFCLLPFYFLLFVRARHIQILLAEDDPGIILILQAVPTRDVQSHLKFLQRSIEPVPLRSSCHVQLFPQRTPSGIKP